MRRWQSCRRRGGESCVNAEKPVYCWRDNHRNGNDGALLGRRRGGGAAKPGLQHRAYHCQEARQLRSKIPAVDLLWQYHDLPVGDRHQAAKMWRRKLVGGWAIIIDGRGGALKPA